MHVQGIDGPNTAQPGEEVEVIVSDGSTTVTIAFPGPNGRSDVSVGPSGRVRFRIPAGLPDGSIVVVVGDKVPPSAHIIEIVQTD